jgi:hypothetical protein
MRQVGMAAQDPAQRMGRRAGIMEYSTWQTHRALNVVTLPIVVVAGALHVIEGPLSKPEMKRRALQMLLLHAVYLGRPTAGVDPRGRIVLQSRNVGEHANVQQYGCPRASRSSACSRPPQESC